jgi:hypothetical protein
MSNTHDEQIATWNQQRGPRVGDWCETKDGGLHRIGGVSSACQSVRTLLFRP